jgi:manganese/iron transport system permease protein
MLFLNQRTKLREDAIIGMIFTSFFALGLFMVSLNPTPINVQTIVLGNMLAITPDDLAAADHHRRSSLTVLALKWKDLMLVFFDESHARTIGLRTPTCCGCVLHPAVGLHRGGDADGRCLPGDRAGGDARGHRLPAHRPVPRLIVLSVPSASITSVPGAYLSYFLDGATGGVIVLLMTGLFLIAFVFAPKHGMLARGRRRAARPEDGGHKS